MTSTLEPANFRYEIEIRLVNCVQLLGNGKFLPENEIEHLTTTQSIEEVLTAYKIPIENNLVEFIHQQAARAFLALVYSELVPVILDFRLHGFCDEDLPIEREPGKNPRVKSLDETSNQLRSHNWGCFTHLRHRDVEYFIDKQWMFLAPVFRGQSFHRRLDCRRPLPFIGTDESSAGKFSTVHKVKIPRIYLQSGGGGDIVVAVKKFHDNTHESFKKEVGLLQVIRDVNHDHLIKPLAAFENGIIECILFPWCDGRNLRHYWKNSAGYPSNELISWTLSQIAGLCSCLKWLWNLNIRHGDLKPENILHEGGRHNFLIADFGISKMHLTTTEMRNRSTSTQFATYRYESPEFKTNHSNHKALSRDVDTWSMGVLLLEWLFWLLNYSDGLKTLGRVDRFWDEDKGEAIVNAKCRRLMQEIANTMDVNVPDHCLKHLLSLIQERLLIVRLARKGEPLQSGRAKATELSDRMDEIASNCSYSREPITCETVDNIQTLTENLYPSDGSSTAVEDGISSQQYTAQRPDRYDELGIQVDDVWKSQTDNNFGCRILRDFDWDFLKRLSSWATLCGYCETIDVTFPDSQMISYNMSSLITMSRTCNLCALLSQCLLNVGVKRYSAGRLVYKDSTLMDEATGMPVISINRDINLNVDTLHAARFGFPQLPKPGSSEQLKFIREWLSNCDECHGCRPPPSPIGESRMPMRLLYVGTSTRPTIRLVNTNGQPDSAYVALSHCWGNIPENLRFFTNRDNICSRENGIDFEMLPKTFQDAVTVTRGLGVRYLWIDSLCIIQQDLEDWAVNAGKMETVFSSAYCTIAATSATSYLKGFIHDRPDRPYVTFQKGDSRVYFSKYIDNFQSDVEQAVLNSRGWVLQERALSRRTIHFTSNQVYLECGDGVQCETLAKLHNSKAEFLGDPNFPKSALQYFRAGRIVLFQALYEMYSKLAFTVPTDRSMGIIGLERRLLRTFETCGGYGILECYSGRSLIWKRKCPGKLKRIEYPEDSAIPSWSWMSCSGEISYVSAPFGGVSWNKSIIYISFGEDGRLRNTTQTLAGKSKPEIRAPVTNINIDKYRDEILQRLVIDDVTVDDPDTLRCVVLGNDKQGGKDTRCYYVIAIQPCREASSKGIYKRVGAGSLLERHISTARGEEVKIQ